jgi:regulator of replication initiation timing
MNVRKIIKEEISDFDWVSQHLESVPDDPHHMALAQCYGVGVLRDIEPKDWTHYGLAVYENGEYEEYVVGTKEECVDALEEYYDYLIDELGVEGWNTNVIDPVDYMYMTKTDVRLYASDMADSDIDSLSPYEIIERTSYFENYEELEEKISDLESQISELEEQEADLIDQDLEDTEEYRKLVDDLGELEDSLRDYENQKSDMEVDATEEYREDNYEEYKRQLDSDPIEFLIDSGLYGSANEMYENNVLSFDRERFISDLVSFRYYGELSGYDGEYCMEHVDGEDYICLRIN